MTKPIARRQGLVIQELPEEVLVYDLERDRAHCLNETAAFVWQRCDGRNSSAQIARALGSQLNSKIDERIVWLALDQLGRNHLLEKQPAVPQAIKGMHRRAMVKALGIAVSIPLVISISAPTAEAASSCLGQGSPCVPGGAPCCTNLSCSGSAGSEICQ